MTKGARETHLRNLKALREKTGMSAAAYAEHMGISQTTWTAYENGVMDMRLETLWRVADDLGVSADQIMGRPPRKGEKAPAPDLPADRLRSACEGFIAKPREASALKALLSAIADMAEG